MRRTIEAILLVGFLLAVASLGAGCFGGRPRMPSGEVLHAVALPDGRIIWLDEELKVRHMAAAERASDD